MRSSDSVLTSSALSTSWSEVDEVFDILDLPDDQLRFQVAAQPSEDELETLVSVDISSSGGQLEPSFGAGEGADIDGDQRKQQLQPRPRRSGPGGCLAMSSSTSSCASHLPGQQPSSPAMSYTANCPMQDLDLDPVQAAAASPAIEQPKASSGSFSGTGHPPGPSFVAGASLALPPVLPSFVAGASLMLPSPDAGASLVLPSSVAGASLVLASSHAGPSGLPSPDPCGPGRSGPGGRPVGSTTRWNTRNVPVVLRWDDSVPPVGRDAANMHLKRLRTQVESDWMDLTHDPQESWWKGYVRNHNQARAIIGHGVITFGFLRMRHVLDPSTADRRPREDFVVVRVDGGATRLHPHKGKIKEMVPIFGRLEDWLETSVAPGASSRSALTRPLLLLTTEQCRAIAQIDRMPLYQAAEYLLRFSAGPPDRLRPGTFHEFGAEESHFKWWRMLANVHERFRVIGPGIISAGVARTAVEDSKGNSHTWYNGYRFMFVQANMNRIYLWPRGVGGPGRNKISYVTWATPSGGPYSNEG